MGQPNAQTTCLVLTKGDDNGSDRCASTRVAEETALSGFQGGSRVTEATGGDSTIRGVGLWVWGDRPAWRTLWRIARNARSDMATAFHPHDLRRGFVTRNRVQSCAKPSDRSPPQTALRQGCEPVARQPGLKRSMAWREYRETVIRRELLSAPLKNVFGTSDQVGCDATALISPVYGECRRQEKEELGLSPGSFKIRERDVPNDDVVSGGGDENNWIVTVFERSSIDGDRVVTDLITRVERSDIVMGAQSLDCI